MKKKMTIGSAVVAVLALFFTPLVYENYQNAEVVLTAPVDCRVGELVTLDASDSEMDSITWNISPPTMNFTIIDGGKQAIFSAEKVGNYIITVAVVNGKKVDLKITKMAVKEPINVKEPIKQVINFDRVKNLLDDLVPPDNEKMQCDLNDPQPQPKIDSWLPPSNRPLLDRVIKSLGILDGLTDKNRFESEDEMTQAALWGVKHATNGDESWQAFNINLKKYLESSTSQDDCAQKIKNVLDSLKNA